MNIKCAVAEGFKVEVVKDLGGGFRDNVAMCECKWCQGVGGVMVTLGEPTDGKFTMPVHEHCFYQATEYVNLCQPN